VIPSSVATLLDPKLQVPYLYTEIDWNEYAVNTVTDLGIEAEPIIKVCLFVLVDVVSDEANEV
jgi:hypothetical protein